MDAFATRCMKETYTDIHVDRNVQNNVNNANTVEPQ